MVKSLPTHFPCSSHAPPKEAVGRGADVPGTRPPDDYRVRVNALQWVCLGIVVVSTVVGVALFSRGVVAIVRTVRIGRSAPGRSGPVGTRLATLLREVVGHGRFQHRPVVRAAHWVDRVSFPLRVLTLVAPARRRGRARQGLLRGAR